MDQGLISSRKGRRVTLWWACRLQILWICGAACTPAATTPAKSPLSPTSQSLQSRLHSYAMMSDTTAHPAFQAGVQPLSAFVPLDEGAFAYVPPQCVGRKHASLVVLLHGAQMSGFSMLDVDERIFQQAADWFGFILVAPKSAAATWPWALGLQANSAADLQRIDTAIRKVVRQYDINPSRIALAGVSDGATSALILGYVNGDLFSRVIAFSPGLGLGDLNPFPRHGTPPIFVTQGDQDEVLPIANTRAVVPWLKQTGYPVTYVEDHEHHYLTKERAVAGLQWLSGSWPHPGPESQCGE